MMKNNNHRRIRKRKQMKSKTEMKFTRFLVIMVLVIAMGYLTARFVIVPLLGYNADESPIKVTEEASSDVNEKGYALQFGVFSTKEAAQKMVSNLAEKGIETKIIEENNQYKVISPIIQTKDEALGKLNEIKDKDVKDVFIASF